jgi:tRNA pseudouridine38-40 synthase
VDLNEEPIQGADTKGRRTYRLDLEYDGTRFSGWQVQNGERTVQGVIESVLTKLFSDFTRVSAAGRTDAGVHATGQVAHFRALPQRSPESVRSALNANLPPDVRVKAVSSADAAFHARYSALWRAYRYRIALEPVAVGRGYCWICPYRVEHFDDMRRAAKLILGHHSFRSFAHRSEKEGHYRSTVYRSEWTTDGPYLDYRIEANRFLHGMVRFLVGTFVRVGRGKVGADEVAEILSAGDIRRAGPKVPACGLTLTAVGYGHWPGL